MEIPKNIENLKGRLFGRLTVIDFAGYGSSRKTQWLCQCSCGKRSVVKSANLKNGNTRSCGCLEQESKMHANKKHGLRHHPLYHTWLNVKDRCNNPNNRHYNNYGGRGINICPQWQECFKSFYDWAMSSGWKRGLTIERINVNGDYAPANCCWIPLSQQAKNKRNTILIELQGEKFHVEEVAKILGIAKSTVYSRLQRHGDLTLRRECKRPVVQYTADDTFVAEYKSAREAMRQTGVQQSDITRCCQGLKRSAKGTYWRYKDALNGQ